MWKVSALLRPGALAALVAAVGACGSKAPAPTLEPSEQVMIAYDRIPADQVTGAVASVSGEELETVKVTRIEELIRDRLPGVLVTRKPNGDYSFRIRGTRSLIGNNEPLLVIDGIPVNQEVMAVALSNIAPASVVRIDVLKDAGSTAAYGSRGANGVILITTKAFSRY